jgi:hypothetical protein
MRMFERPEGLLGRFGGIVLARTNRKFAEEMVEQAAARNAAAIRTGSVVLRHGRVDSMPFEDDASIRRWRSTRCRSGLMRVRDCERSDGS